eukprot:c24580_g2_i2 orf=100-453(+)
MQRKSFMDFIMQRQNKANKPYYESSTVIAAAAQENCKPNPSSSCIAAAPVAQENCKTDTSLDPSSNPKAELLRRQSFCNIAGQCSQAVKLQRLQRYKSGRERTASSNLFKKANHGHG